MKKIAKKILRILAKSSAIALAAQVIVNYFKNENICDSTENGELHFIKSHAQDFDVVFDVGANIGHWTKGVQEFAPNATVYAFEPAAKTYGKLVENTKDAHNVHTFKLGLGEKTESLKFYVYGDNSELNSSTERSNEHASSTESVDFVKLDDFCAEKKLNKISFLKIDTEGHELAVLKGAEKFIAEGKIAAIQIEYGGTYVDSGTMLKDIFAFFKEKPYKLYKLRAQGLEYIPAYDRELENFQYANYIALQKDAYGNN